MTAFINILLSIAAGTLFIGVIGECDSCKQKTATFAFIAVLLFIVAFNTIM